jgi:HK97 family phage prohead protease
MTDIQRRRKARHSKNPATPEVRQYSAVGLEVRDGDVAGNTVAITGEPIVYNAPYSVRDALGTFDETMQPGVASELIDVADARFLFNHDGMPLARTTSGTLSLTDSPSALRFSANLDLRQSLSQDLVVAIERGDVNQMSVGFIVAQDEWSSDWSQRSISKFQDLLDVSAVTYPASPTTSIQLAQRAMLMAPSESRARIRKLYAIGADLKEGRVLSADDVTILAGATEALHRADDSDLAGVERSIAEIDEIIDQQLEEGRNAPTTKDPGIAAALATAHSDVSAALALQSKDPDANTDPVDKEVWIALTSALGSLTDALEAQSRDGAPDADTTDGISPEDDTVDGDDGSTVDRADGSTGPGTGQGAVPIGDRSQIPDTAELRAAALESFDDIERAVVTAILESLQSLSNPYPDVWLVDCGPASCVYQAWGEPCGTYTQGYTIDGVTVVLDGEPVQVAQVTTWVPVEDEDEDEDVSVVEQLSASGSVTENGLAWLELEIESLDL